MRNVRFNKIRKKVLKGYSGLSLQPYSADPVSQNLNKYKDLGDIMARNAMYYSDTQVALAKLKQEDLLRRKNEASYALNQKPKKLEAPDPVLNNLNSKYQEVFSDQSLVPNYMQDINSFQKDLDIDTSSLLSDQQKIYAGLETADYSTDEDTNINLVSANRKNPPENSKFSYNANWKDINRGLDLAEMNLHAIGAHDKDSQGTAMAKGIIYVMTTVVTGVVKIGRTESAQLCEKRRAGPQQYPLSADHGHGSRHARTGYPVHDTRSEGTFLQ